MMSKREEAENPVNKGFTAYHCPYLKNQKLFRCLI